MKEKKPKKPPQMNKDKTNMCLFICGLLPVVISLVFAIVFLLIYNQFYDSEDECIGTSNVNNILIFAIVIYCFLAILCLIGLLHHIKSDNPCASVVVYNTCALQVPFYLIHTGLVIFMLPFKID